MYNERKVSCRLTVDFDPKQLSPNSQLSTSCRLTIRKTKFDFSNIEKNFDFDPKKLSPNSQLSTSCRLTIRKTKFDFSNIEKNFDFDPKKN